MRPLWTALAAAVLAASVISGQRGSAADPADDHRRSMGNLRPDSYTAGRAIQGSNSQRRASPGAVVPSPPVNQYQYPVRQYYVPYGYGYGYYSPYYGYYPRRYRYPRVYYPYPPPLYLPAERLYGPQAVKRFMGVAP